MKYKVGDKLKNHTYTREIMSVNNGYYHTLDDAHGVAHFTDEQLKMHGFTLHHDRPDLKVDDKILVRDYANNNYPWVRRHFAGWDGDKVKTFSDGKTLFTTNASYRTWNHYKLPESED